MFEITGCNIPKNGWKMQNGEWEPYNRKPAETIGMETNIHQRVFIPGAAGISIRHIFEIRAKIDIRKGSWPHSGLWAFLVASNGEVDIMEYYNGKLHANVAWE